MAADPGAERESESETRQQESAAAATVVVRELCLPPACDGDLCLGIRRAQRALERGGEVVFAISRGKVNGQPAAPDFIRLPCRYNTGELGGCREG